MKKMKTWDFLGNVVYYLSISLLEGNCFREKENELTKAGAVV
jgi:hypothetical protein